MTSSTDMHLTKKINYCPPASACPAHVSWVDLVFDDQQPQDEDSHPPLAQPQPGDIDLTYSFRKAMTVPTTYLTRYRLTVN